MNRNGFGENFAKQSPNQSKNVTGVSSTSARITLLLCCQFRKIFIFFAGYIGSPE